MNELYALLRLRTNYFLPSMKLLEKQRVGSRVHKKYDRPKTPYQRALGVSLGRTRGQESPAPTVPGTEPGGSEPKDSSRTDRLASQNRLAQKAQHKNSLGIHQQKEGRPFPPDLSAACLGERRMAPAEKG